MSSKINDVIYLKDILYFSENGIYKRKEKNNFNSR